MTSTFNSFDSHPDVLFKEQELSKFSDIYLYQIGKFMNPFKRGLLPNYLCDKLCLLLQASYIRIILEFPIFFTYLPDELCIFINSQFGFKDLRFSTP